MPPPAEGFASRLFLGPALRTQPDRRLVALVREGYETAFEEIVRRYGRPLTRYAASIVGGRSEDVTQDAFSKALLALRRDNAEIELRPWLFRIVRNTALNDLRDSPPSPQALAEKIAGGGNPAEELERREELADLMRRLRALPEAQRAAIVMRELEGLSHDEIAAALGLSGGGARQAIYRARQALREGAGMLVPLPLLKAMLSGTAPGATELAAGAAGMGGTAGAGVAIKATAATVLVAGAVGAGVALDGGPRSGEAKATPAPARVAPGGPGRPKATASFAPRHSTAAGRPGPAADDGGGDRRPSGGGEAREEDAGIHRSEGGGPGPSSHAPSQRRSEDHRGPSRAVAEDADDHRGESPTQSGPGNGGGGGGDGGSGSGSGSGGESGSGDSSERSGGEEPLGDLVDGGGLSE